MHYNSLQWILGYQLFFPIMHVYAVLSAKYVNSPWCVDKIDQTSQSSEHLSSISSGNDNVCLHVFSLMLLASSMVNNSYLSSSWDLFLICCQEDGCTPCASVSAQPAEHSRILWANKFKIWQNRKKPCLHIPWACILLKRAALCIATLMQLLPPLGVNRQSSVLGWFSFLLESKKYVAAGASYIVIFHQVRYS